MTCKGEDVVHWKLVLFAFISELSEGLDLGMLGSTESFLQKLKADGAQPVLLYGTFVQMHKKSVSFFF